MVRKRENCLLIQMLVDIFLSTQGERDRCWLALNGPFEV